MAQFIIDVVLDGYDSEEEMLKSGLEEWIYDQLNFGGSGVTVRKLTKFEVDLIADIKEFLDERKSK